MFLFWVVFSFVCDHAKNPLQKSLIIASLYIKYKSIHNKIRECDVGKTYVVSQNTGVTNCCQISYTLPEISFEISEITKISKSEIKES